MINKCAVCHSLIDEEDLFCANCGTEAPRSAAADGAAGQEGSHKSTYNFVCQGCGASMSYDASQQALRCPFCGSVELASQPDVKALAPQAVVPFRLQHPQAMATLRQWLGRSIWRPTGLESEAQVVKITPVYVPYWVFAARTHTNWTADTNHTPPGARANWYPMTGEHHGEYAGLLVGASGALTPAETAAICPFDLSAGVSPDQVDLEQITYEQFSLPRKYARPQAQQGLEASEVQEISRHYVPGQARNVHANVLIEGMTSYPVLLPVWIMAYRYKDQLYRFLINGQTGRPTGQAPISWLKVGLAATAVVLVVGVAALVLASLAQ